MTDMKNFRPSAALVTVGGAKYRIVPELFDRSCVGCRLDADELRDLCNEANEKSLCRRSKHSIFIDNTDEATVAYVAARLTGESDGD